MTKAYFTICTTLLASVCLHVCRNKNPYLEREMENLGKKQTNKITTAKQTEFLTEVCFLCSVFTELIDGLHEFSCSVLSCTSLRRKCPRRAQSLSLTDGCCWHSSAELGLVCLGEISAKKKQEQLPLVKQGWQGKVLLGSREKDHQYV